MRKARIRRVTKEVNIHGELNLEGRGEYKITSGIEFLDHMLSLFAKHGLFDLKLKAKGDLGVGIHHTNEDIGMELGKAFHRALGEKKRIRRFGWSFVCMDDALVRAVVDISGRAYLRLKRYRFYHVSDPPQGIYSFNYFKQFLEAFSHHARITIHLEILEGEDFHHVLEACFKALALALKMAVSIEKRKKSLPTTKGKID